MLALVLVVIVAYLLGTIPFALLLTRWGTGVDVRRVGSGNPGAANVWRSTGPALGLSVLVLDCAKGAAAVMIARAAGVDRDGQALAGLAVVLGHVFPPWLRFHGGKGVAAASGAFLIVTPMAFGVAFVVFAITVALTRYVSAGSILGALALTITVLVMREPLGVIGATACVSALIMRRHRENLVRLLRGSELRIDAADLRGEHAVTHDESQSESNSKSKSK